MNGEFTKIFSSEWLLQKGIYVILLAAALWVQVHFVSRTEFMDNIKAQDHRAEETNNKLNDISITMARIDERLKESERNKK